MKKDKLKDFKYLGLIKDLKSSEYNWCQISNVSGVYVIIYKQSKNPRFLSKGTGGWFKKKNPNVSIEKLKDKWVIFTKEKDKLLYIGQSNNLRRRIKSYIRFGNGCPVAKWGGRYIWQIDGADRLEVYFKESDNPRKTEKQLIQDFKDNNKGRLPFANIIH